MFYPDQENNPGSDNQRYSVMFCIISTVKKQSGSVNGQRKLQITHAIAISWRAAGWDR